MYLLECSDGSLYCGWTTHLEQRLKKHNQGTASKYTRGRLPVKYVYTSEVESKSAALKKEYAIKQLSRAQKLAIIEGGVDVNT